MKTFINRTLIFPTIHEVRVSAEKMVKARQIKHQILTEMCKNKNPSIYTLRDRNIHASAYIKRKKIAIEEAQKLRDDQCELKRCQTNDSYQKEDQHFHRRNSICISDLISDGASPIKMKRIIISNDSSSTRRSLETIRNNLRMKLLKFKTQMKKQSTIDSGTSDNQQLKEIFTIRSISKGIKAKNAMKYRNQAKKLFKNPPKEVKKPFYLKTEPLKSSKTNVMRITRLNGWTTDEQNCNIPIQESDILPKHGIF